MLNKLKNNSGVAMVLALIFFAIMVLLTTNALDLVDVDTTSISNYKKNDYYYFVAKATSNYYVDMLSGLQYDNTIEEFSFDTGDTTVDSDKLTTLEAQVNFDDFQSAFVDFQFLRSKVLDNTTDLTLFDPAYPERLLPHQVFTLTFVMDGLPNELDQNGDFTITTDLTFFCAGVEYDGFNSTEENTARLKVTLSSSGAVVYTQSVSCVPENTTTDILEWKSFS